MDRVQWLVLWRRLWFPSTSASLPMTPKPKNEHAQKLAKRRWDKATKAERLEVGKVLAEARRKKKGK